MEFQARIDALYAVLIGRKTLILNSSPRRRWRFHIGGAGKRQSTPFRRRG